MTPGAASDLTRRIAHRLDALAAAQPDLAPAIDLQRRLLGEQITLLSGLARHGVAAPSWDTAELAHKLRGGLPVLRGERLDLPVAQLVPALSRFCAHLADGGAGDVARHLLEALESGRVSPASLLRASLARDRRSIQSGATQMGVSPDLLWLVGELATAPLAYLLQCRLFDRREDEHDALAAALAGWTHGSCPVCGSWPALIEAGLGTRVLRCSYCAAAWQMSARACVYCGEEGTAFVTLAPDPDRPRHLVELCDRCDGYTKMVVVEGPTPFPLVAIDDLETLALDREAAQRGYGRPPLVEWDGLPQPACG